MKAHPRNSIGALYLLFVAVLTATPSVEKAPLNLETGQLTFYRPWADHEDIQQSDFVLPIQKLLDDRIVVGMKTMEVEERQSGNFQKTYMVHIWISEEDQRLSCILRQVNLGLFRLQVSYMKLNLYELGFLQVKSHLELHLTPQSGQNQRFKNQQYVWSQEDSLLHEYQWNLKKKLMMTRFRSLPLLTGFTLQKGLNNQISLNMEVERMNNTHLKFKNHFKGIQSLKFDLLFFRQIELFQQLISYEMQTLPYSETQKSIALLNSEQTSNTIFVLSSYEQRLNGNIKKLNNQKKQLNKILSLRFWRVSCPYGYYWDVELNKCVPICQNNVLESTQVCLSSFDEEDTYTDEFIKEENNGQVEMNQRTNPERFLSCSSSSSSRGGGGGTGCSVSNCISCKKSYSNCKSYCTNCKSGYYLGSGGWSCVACPSTCTTCFSYTYKSKNYITCTACKNNLTLIGTKPATCGCTSTQFLASGSCYNCPTGCATCTSNTACATCAQGYYYSAVAPNCPACRPVCKTCTSISSCTSCESSKGFTLGTGNLCACSSSTFLDPVTLSCLSCSTLYPNCQTCIYSGGYSSLTPVPVVCSIPASGYYVLGSGAPAACGSYCTSCTSPTICDVSSCISNFDNVVGICTCPTTPNPTFPTNVSPITCVICTNIVAGCATCIVATTTQCQSCSTGFYAASYPTSTCIACNATCLDCTSQTSCVTCRADMYKTANNQCLCSVGYLEPITQTCQPCHLVIANCLTCDAFLPTKCLTSATGTYISADGTQVLPCPLNCASCTISGCSTPSLGYTLSGGIISCDTACTSCLGTISHCTLCVPGTPITCGGCENGYYLDTSGATPICVQCSSYCQQCTTGTACLSCSATFTLTTSLTCNCNATASMYLTAGSLCDTCSNIFTNCSSCSTSMSVTSCTACADGSYLTSSIPNICQPCPYPCKTCSGPTTSDCITCLGLFVRTTAAPSGTCDCPITLWYSIVTLNCQSCSFIVPNCLTCGTMGFPTYTGCTLCADPYYADPATGTCILCDETCTSCTGPGLCSACANNLVVLAGPIGYCVPDTISDPNLAYYGPSNSAVSCLDLLSNCLSCTPVPLACNIGGCAPGTFLNGTVCQNCPSSCVTCDATGCTGGCPAGLTLNGTECQCTGTCLICMNSIANCLTCTITGTTVSSCLSCEDGYYLLDGICYPCTTGCGICSSSTVCTLCLQTFTLSGGTCSCDASLNLYPNGPVCQVCSDLIYGCISCSASGSSTSCVTCDAGLYLTTTGTCNPCSPSCATCTNSTLCTSCPSGYTLSPSYTCTCGITCINCGTGTTNCVSCDLNVFGNFGQCTSCGVGYYLTTSYTCSICPPASNCVTCVAGGVCTSCSLSLQIVSGVCQCNAAKGMILNTGTNLCQSCSGQIPNCILCASNASLSTGYQCTNCSTGYYLSNYTCLLEICGDGKITISQDCDDGNNLNGDGCFNCQVENNYACSGQPSICFMATDFKINFNSLTVSSTVCNQLIISFALHPIYDDYSDADFNNMLMSYSGSSLQKINQKTSYKGGIVSYSFNYSSQVAGDQVKFYFMPSLLGIASTASIGLYPLFFGISSSNNSILLKYYNQDECSKKDAVSTFVNSVQYVSYGVLMVSALPSKIVGLELFGVLQLSFLTLGNIDNLNPLLASFTQLSGSNGLNLQLDDKQKTKSRLLQQNALTPSRVQTIGYSSNFLRNCNLMLIIVYAIMVGAFLLYLLTFLLKKCSPTLFSLSKRIFKQVLLTLILFNCFNFSYSSGLHFAYADKDDSLYILGTVAAVTTIVIPLLMVVVLQCTQQQGFGQYKDKLRRGCLQRAYFMITIMYRMGIGYYTATMNESSLSSLIVLALSLFFLLYNLVNLPFQKAYHNYRANICHITQFICLFVGMYYRSMKSTSSVDEVNTIYTPVYIQIIAIAISLLVSVVVLCYQVYIWIVELKNNCCKKTQEQRCQDSSIAKIQKSQLKKEHNNTYQNFELDNEEPDYK